MRRLKIISPLIESAKTRPLIAAALVILLIDLIYVNYIFIRPTPGPGEEHIVTSTANAVLTGVLRDKTFDETGNIKSITVGRTMCYVNRINTEQTGVKLGATVRVRGSIKEMEGPMNPGEFNRKNYYGARGVFFEMGAESVETIKEPKV